MKKLFIVLCVLAFASTGNCSSLSKGLIGHWPLTTEYSDATYEAKDATPYAQHGTASSAPTVGATYTEFDGADDYMDMGAIDPIGTGTFTWSAWVYVQGDGAHGQYEVIFTNGKTIIYWDDSFDRITFTRNNSNAFPALENSVPKNTWTHLLLTSTSGGGAQWYVNGSTSGAADTGVTIVAGDGNLMIGSDDVPTFPFDGFLSDMRIYDRVLSQEEISLLYKMDRPKTPSTANLDKGLIGHWPLTTEYSDATYDSKDSTPNANHGTGSNLTVGATYTEFNGTTSKVDLGGNVVDDGDITFSAWMYTTGSGAGTYEYLYNNGNFHCYWHDVADRVVVYSDGSSASFSVTDSVLINTWYHVLVTRDTTGANTNFYINGVLSGAANQDSGTPAAGTGNDVIGNRAGNDRSIDGYLSDIRIYNRILTSAEISLLYAMDRPKTPSTANLDKGLIGHWPLTTEYSDATYDSKDSTPYANHGTGSNLTVGATYTEFDGADSKIDTGTNVVDDGDITFSAWIYTQGSGESTSEIFYSNGQVSILFDDGSGDDHITVKSDSLTPADSDPFSILKNTWFHVLVTRDTTGASTVIYLNGVASGGTQDSGTPAVGDNNDIIGATNAGAATFDGYLSDIRIYNRILTSAEIALLYESDRGKYQ